MKHRFNFICSLIFIAGLLIMASFESYAQRMGSFMQNQTATGSSSNTMQRYYYPRGMIGEAIIEADHDTRSIVVITDEYTNEHIKAIIENLDRPVKQVLIKVVFVEVTYRDDVDFGVEGAIDINNSQPGSNVFETAFGLAAESAGGVYTLLEKDVNLTIRAISEVGKMEVLSRPSILTRNNQEALITVGKYVPFPTSSNVTSTGIVTNNVEYSDIGIILRVTPFITKKGLVEMILQPEISTTTDETVPISETLDAPVFAKRTADTVVATPNGQTVVIGGLMEDNKTEVVKKVPVLGDIPLLGLAFRRTQKENSKTELLIFLTPYVVEGPEQVVEISNRERNNSEFMSKAFSDVQMKKYIEPMQQPAPEAQNSQNEYMKQQHSDTKTKPETKEKKRLSPVKKW